MGILKTLYRKGIFIILHNLLFYFNIYVYMLFGIFICRGTLVRKGLAILQYF